MANRKYAAVSIAMPATCCAPVRTLKGLRILVAQAPKLPLPICTMPDQCRCRFVKHDDRRDGDQDRRFLEGRTASYQGANRRKSRGRRNTD